MSSYVDAYGKIIDLHDMVLVAVDDQLHCAEVVGFDFTDDLNDIVFLVLEDGITTCRRCNNVVFWRNKYAV